MTNKLRYFIGNWKMFGDFTSIKIIRKIHLHFAKFKKLSKKSKIIICVPDTLIYFFSRKLKSKIVSLGAQNCHQYNNSGPFTGSVSASMVRKAGAKYIILGHSEKRIEGDTNSIIRKKIEVALSEKLNVIFCIGESLIEKRKNKP